MFDGSLLFLLTLMGLLAAAPSSTLAQGCPPADVLAPCTCDERHLGISCYNEGDDPNFDLQAVFDRITPLVDENEVFPFCAIGNLPPSYRQLPANLTSLKFVEIQIGFCPSLEYIHPEAFNGSYETTRLLLLTNNKLSNSKTSPTDNFEFFGQFPNLEWLHVTEEHLQYIPSNPWPTLLDHFTTLELDLCGLVGVGSRFLANMPYLGDAATISYCNMSVEGFAADAFEGLGKFTDLYLTRNPIPYLPQEIFQPALDLAQFVHVGGRRCPGPPQPCYDQTLVCDEAARWLCNNQTAYQHKLEGFICESGGEEGYDVWDWCRDNPSP